jgi:hypothetical protein
MPTIVDVVKLQQTIAPAPAQFQRKPDGSAPLYVVWRAAFTDDTGFVHFEAQAYGVCETQKTDFVLTGTGTFDDDGNEIFSSAQVLLPFDCPEASALLAQGLVDEAVATDIARVKAALEDPNNPVGSVP